MEFTDVKRERWAAALLQHVRNQHFDRLTAWVLASSMTGRPLHEARRAAQAFDALLASGVPISNEGMEILIRTVTGIMYAEEHSNAKLLHQMEWNPPGAAVPIELSLLLMKQASRVSQAGNGPGAGKRSGDKN